MNGDLRRHMLVAGDLAVLAATVSFELDPSLLPAVVEDFRQLLPVF